MPKDEAQDNGPPDVSDRAAALDRYARLGLVDCLLRDLGGIAARHDEHYPDYRDRSDAANATRLEYDWLGELPEDVDTEGDAAGALAEFDALFTALWPGDIDDGTPWGQEWMVASVRSSMMTARLLTRMAAHPDWLLETAAGHLSWAANGIRPKGAGTDA